MSISENKTTPSPYENCMDPEPYYEYEIPSVLAATIGITSDVVIIYTLLKFDILNNPSNKYILHWCICNIMLLISIPTCFHMFALDCFLPEKLLTSIFDASLSCTLGNMIFATLLVSDWYICTYQSRICATTCRQYSKFITLLAWVLILAFFVVTVIFSINDINFPVIIMSLSLGSAAEVLLVIVVHMMRFMKPTSLKMTPLILVTAHTLFWVPSWFYLFHHSLYLHGISIPYQVEFALLALGFLNPAILLYLMYRYDETFRDCLRMLCKSERRQHIELKNTDRGNAGGKLQSVSLM